jgi:hypothetical protein
VGYLRDQLGVSRPVVIDRGGDRRVLFENFLGNEQEFIIRQRGDRHIYTGDSFERVDEYAENIDCEFSRTVLTAKNGKRELAKFRGGATQVWFPKKNNNGVFEKPLWLVRLTRKNGAAESWYLCDISAESAENAFDIAMEGYGCRWTIEEVHREIKVDYHLESIQLHRYQALKNFNTIFWTAMNFIYQHLEGLCVDLILDCEEKLSYKPGINDITGFVYYKLSQAVHLIFRRHKLNSFIKISPQQSLRQLNLALE